MRATRDRQAAGGIPLDGGEIAAEIGERDTVSKGDRVVSPVLRPARLRAGLRHRVLSVIKFAQRNEWRANSRQRLAQVSGIVQLFREALAFAEVRHSGPQV